MSVLATLMVIVAAGTKRHIQEEKLHGSLGPDASEDGFVALVII
jgi:hypothetical protein